VLKDPGKQPLVIDYRMTKSANGWKVIDVAVEGVSLVTDYRSPFAAEVNRSGIDGLIKVLDQKSQALARQ
jgi:phospholipid transport system substrate-binding protein